MVITSHMSDTSKAAVVFSHFRSPFWLFALLPALISLVIPATAWGDIFKWTDEQGRMVVSNVPPTKSGKANNVQLLVEETRPATKAPASIREHVATPTEQALIAKIESLERQLQAPQYAAQAPTVPPPTPYGGYYPSTPPPPPPSSSYYGSGYYSGYYSSYPSYYPSYYYPVMPSYSYAVYPARTFISRPVFAAPRGGSYHGGGGHRGRR